MSVGIGASGGQSGSTTTAHPDATSLAFNTMRLQQMMNLNQASGGIAGPYQGMFENAQPSQQTQDLGVLGGQEAQQGYVNAGDFYTQTLQGLQPWQQQQNMQNLYGQQAGAASGLSGQYGQNLTDLSGQNAQQYGNAMGAAAQGFGNAVGQAAQGYGQAMQYGVNAYQQAMGAGAQGFGAATSQVGNALNTLYKCSAIQQALPGAGGDVAAAAAGYGTASLTDRAQLQALSDRYGTDIQNFAQQQLLPAGQGYYNQIVAPQIAGDQALMGLGRSGAAAEAQAKGAAGIALPLEQQVAQLLAQNQIAGYQGQVQTGM